MANPQPDQFTRISNELLEALARIRISGEENQVLNVIIRKTYGWQKKEDAISLKQFCDLTTMSKSAVCRAIRKLRLKNLIKTNNLGYITIYAINKDYDEWSTELLKYDRMKIFRRDKFICFHCGNKFDVSELEVDHLVPLHNNGTNKESNLVTSCRTCNRKRGVLNLTRWQNSHSGKKET